MYIWTYIYVVNQRGWAESTVPSKKAPERLSTVSTGYIYMNIFFYIHTHIHIYAYIHTYVYINTCKYIYTYIYTYIYIYVYINIYTYKNVFLCKYSIIYLYTLDQGGPVERRCEAPFRRRRRPRGWAPSAQDMYK